MNLFVFNIDDIGFCSVTACKVEKYPDYNYCFFLSRVRHIFRFNTTMAQSKSILVHQ